MTLKQWFENSWLRQHKTKPSEISDLLQIVDRDLEDARERHISNDWRFGIAYNAALKLCTILLYAEGYRSERALQHYRTIQSLPLILGENRKDDAQYLDVCRSKRNIVEYDQIGAVSEQDADELIEFCCELRGDVLNWLRESHPELIKRFP
ncbi:MAG: hypothetical protein HOK67_29785 [Deltaproteobacteria bacterium]|jgi:hypothetical protein|nr:hypothetical protein [Deltaproteobacteria bacterium]MBT7710914.1 hypothetical protein [Deltaproteobacteria bacterium]